ncbi:phospholipase D-like domain-containing protein [Vannielia litorea]|uniref:Phospholipase D n=1 Tax=Vannielia litorea TaxID=1217970 RepID=A0A1N6ERT2_9RHOB|nr:phospholipase D-like domain-containing protein [Vannielia litorea]SIN85718.1 cardiolipin synthase [Vannielia litorea]
MITLLLTLHALLVIGFTLRILLRDDLSPPARMAWFVVLAAVPYIGTAAYFLFGEVDIGHEAARHDSYIFAQIDEWLRAHPQTDATSALPPQIRPAFRTAASINGFTPAPGNEATLLEDGAAARDAMIADIDAATDHVHVMFYIWLQDETGTALARALIRAARRGVLVRAMADALGSRAMLRSALWKEMGDAGVHTATALPLDKPLRTLLTARIDLRNHRKITVIDGRVTWCGSGNAADPAFRPKHRFAPWVDIMLRFTGPVVTQNALLFASDWMAATGTPLTQLAIAPARAPSSPAPALASPAPRAPSSSDPTLASPAPGFPAVALGDGPTLRPGATPQLFATLLAAAQERITLTTPYFVPDATVLSALAAAANRGVATTLVFPRRNDSLIVRAASRSYYRQLLEAGCRIHEFEGGLLHAKTLTIDGATALIGSSNLDLRSFDLNYENNILLHDRATTATIEARQAEYLARSKEITLATVRGWPLRQRIWQNAVATIGPIL